MDKSMRWREREGGEKVNNEISINELIRTMKKMKNNKAAEEDGFVIKFMKALPREGLIELTEIFNEFWKNEEIQRGWEVGRIFSIHEAGDTGKASNYKGVLLLNAGYKLLASIITE